MYCRYSLVASIVLFALPSFCVAQDEAYPDRVFTPPPYYHYDETFMGYGSGDTPEVAMDLAWADAYIKFHSSDSYNSDTLSFFDVDYDGIVVVMGTPLLYEVEGDDGETHWNAIWKLEIHFVFREPI